MGPDPTQAAVIDAPLGARMFVEAPPGAGKTWTAAQRLLRLAFTEESHDEGSTLLALAFSRAAALAMSTELYRHGLGARVEVRTIDSWCSAVLAQNGLLPEHFELDDFERRLEHLDLELRAGGLSLPTYRHVIVDEAQDVLGTRARLIQALLEAPTTAGWTVLGDPAQTIFGFSDDGPTLFELARTAGATASTLGGLYRASDTKLSAIVSLGLGLRALPVSEEAVTATTDALLGLRSLSQAELETVARSYGEGPDTSVVLARTNREVLGIAEGLAASGAKFQLLAMRDAQLLPPWLAGLSAPHRPWVDEAEVLSVLPGGIDASSVVRAIRVLSSAGSKRLSVDALASALRSRRCPEALLQLGSCALSISTIHRAKGLEFDRVLVTADWGNRPEGDRVSDARLLYVALTRARSKLYRLELSRRFVWDRDARTGRMRDYRFVGAKRRVVAAVELRPGDIDFLQPWNSIGDRIEAMQTVGSASKLLLCRVSADSAEIPVFELTLPDAGTVLGHTREPFGETIAGLGWQRSRAMRGAQVMGRQTVVLPLGALDNGVRLIEVPIVGGMVMPTEGDSDGE
jgi:DNA helicase II / ATP-dependent DNA helicase PcrA